MSSYYLCDVCRRQAGSVEMKNYCCLAPGKAWITHKTRRVMDDGKEDPRDVCRFYEPREKVE